MISIVKMHNLTFLLKYCIIAFMVFNNILEAKMLTIISKTVKSGRPYFICKCDCGEMRTVRADSPSLASKEKCKRVYLPGKKYGKLTILEILPNNKALCKCECGNETVVLRNNLGRANTSSCGCIWNEKVRDRGRNEIYHKYLTEYRSYIMMKNRCNNKNADNYEYYGGRGIKICPEWNVSFANFIQDMGKKPGKNYSIERIDNNLGYSPTNCRWATMKEQCKNRRPKGTTKKYNKYCKE